MPLLEKEKDRPKTLTEAIEPFLREREGEFTQSKTITVFCGTWNVNGKDPPKSLQKWLCDVEEAPDIYAVGFQEMDLTGQALLLGDTSKAAPWEELILNNINTKGNYSLVQSKQLVGMFLCVFVKVAFREFISDIRSAAAGCGIMGKMGNKGAVGVRFQLFDTSICFVNSHLSAHAENVQRRNQDYKEICRRLLFEDVDPTKPAYHILDHQALFWLGDLNYRIDMDGAKVRNMIANGKHLELLCSDQLLKERGQNNCFEHFQEAVIDFLPTYKYDTGTDVYDSSEKQRSPAWCDRVLWYGEAITRSVAYKRAEILSSDHRPVTALLLLQAKQTLIEEKQAVTRDIVKKFDQQENKKIPQCRLSTNSLDFGSVGLNTPVTKTVRVTNQTASIKENVVQFRLVPKPSATSLCKPWLQVNPDHGILVPDESVDIEFTILINSEIAPPLNFNKEDLYDILIFRLENGTDYYIEVKGKFKYTCIGNTLENLVRHPKPIRENKPLSLNTAVVLSIPKELWRLVDYLYRNGLDEIGLFSEPGDDGEIKQVVELLDTGKDLSEFQGSIHSVGGCLLFFLESLSHPVIPSSVFSKSVEVFHSFTNCKKFLLGISTTHYNVFHYLIAFFRDGILAHTEANNITVDDLVEIFARVLLRPGDRDEVAILDGCAQFLKNFLLVPRNEVVPTAQPLIQV